MYGSRREEHEIQLKRQRAPSNLVPRTRTGLDGEHGRANSKDSITGGRVVEVSCRNGHGHEET